MIVLSPIDGVLIQSISHLLVPPPCEQFSHLLYLVSGL